MTNMEIETSLDGGAAVGAAAVAEPTVGAIGRVAPDPEVRAKARRRTYPAAYKRRILAEADRCAERGALGALLRREGLYSSHLIQWRAQRRRGDLAGLAPKKRGPHVAPRNPLAPRVEALERENRALHREMAKARTILEIQKKASELLGIPLNPPEIDERG